MWEDPFIEVLIAWYVRRLRRHVAHFGDLEEAVAHTDHDLKGRLRILGREGWFNHIKRRGIERFFCYREIEVTA